MTEVVRARPDFDDTVERLREALSRDHRQVEVTDLGSGASHYPSLRRVSAIARRSLSPRRWSSLYQRMILYYQCRTVVELGTSLGLNALYLARTPGTEVHTFEGAPALADLARETFDRAGQSNIHIIEGNINTSLPEFAATGIRVDFALMDANHTEAATVGYFHLLLKIIHDESILVVDDIHHSRDMESAWRRVQAHERVRATADLYRCGIAFFSPLLNKQHVVLRV